MKNSLLSCFIFFCFYQAQAQSVTGNGGNGNAFYQYYANSYLRKIKPLAPMPLSLDFNLVVFTPEHVPDLVASPSEQVARHKVCREFFTKAYRTWRELLIFNRSSGAFDLSELPNRMTFEQLVYWDSFLKLDFDFLCSSTRFSRGFVNTTSSHSYVAANFPRKFKIIFNDLFLPLDKIFFCAKFANDGPFYNDCPDVLYGSIALHEVLSLVLPEYEGSYHYILSSYYLNRKVNELNFSKLAIVE